MKETGDVSRAQDTVESLREQYAELEAEFTAESTQLAARIDPLTEPLETVTLRPKKTNITPKLVAPGLDALLGPDGRHDHTGVEVMQW